MSFLAFPIVGALVVFLGAIPLVTIPAKLALVVLRRVRPDLPHLGTTTTWLLLVGPLIGPLVWFASAAAHQAEPGHAVATCLLGDLEGDSCPEPLALAALLLGLATVATGHGLARSRPFHRDRPTPLPPSHPAARRLARLAAHADLPPHARAVAVCDAAVPLCTRGLLRPRIEVDRTALDTLDDDTLLAALRHEAAHGRGRDPLRTLLAQVAVAINPAGRLLQPELQRWRLAREAACDAEAVAAGAAPLDLARAIVALARPEPRPQPAVAGIALLHVELRVGLLLAYAESGLPGRPKVGRIPVAAVATALLAAVAAAPHAWGTGPLDDLHVGIERSLASPALD